GIEKALCSHQSAKIGDHGGKKVIHESIIEDRNLAKKFN
ncbi:unnamed protein product, partial [marine sediment metagenome]